MIKLIKFSYKHSHLFRTVLKLINGSILRKVASEMLNLSIRQYYIQRFVLQLCVLTVTIIYTIVVY